MDVDNQISEKTYLPFKQYLQEAGLQNSPYHFVKGKKPAWLKRFSYSAQKKGGA